MSRKRAAGLAVVAVVLAALGGGWLLLRQVGDSRLQSAITQFRASLAPDGGFTYAHAEARPLHLGAVFTDVAIRRHGILTTAAQLTLGRVGRQHIGSARLRDVHVQGLGLAASIASIDANDLSSPKGSQAPAQAPIWSDTRVGALRMHDVALQIDAIPGAGARAASIDFSQTSDGHGGAVQDTRIRGVTILGRGGQPFETIDRLTGHLSGSPAAIVATSEAAGLAIPPDSAPGRQFAQLGYQGATGDAHSAIRLAFPPGAPEGGRLDVDSTVLRLDGVCRLTLTLGLDHLPAQLQQPATPAQSILLMAQARLSGLTLTYDDAGLVPRLLQRTAQRSGATSDRFRAALEQNLRQRATMDGGLGFEQPAIRFLDDPRRLTITLHPAAPLTLSDFAALQAQPTPATVIQTLGLSVTAD